MNGYDVQAEYFLKKANAKMTISRVGEIQGFPFDHDRMWHYKYQITLTRDHKQYRFMFYDSFMNWNTNKRPSHYDVLAGVEKYDVADTLEDFAADFGYVLNTPQDKKRVEKIRQACKKQYEKLLWLFGEELMEDLRDIL